MGSWTRKSSQPCAYGTGDENGSCGPFSSLSASLGSRAGTTVSTRSSFLTILCGSTWPCSPSSTLLLFRRLVVFRVKRLRRHIGLPRKEVVEATSHRLPAPTPAKPFLREQEEVRRPPRPVDHRVGRGRPGRPPGHDDAAGRRPTHGLFVLAVLHVRAVPYAKAGHPLGTPVMWDVAGP